jgi:chromosome segregation ATPase
LPDWTDILDLLTKYWKVLAGIATAVAVTIGGLYKLATDLEGYIEKRIKRALDSRDAVVELQQQNTDQALAVNEGLVQERAHLENQIRDLQNQQADLRDQMDNDRAKQKRENERMARRMNRAEAAEARCLERVQKQTEHIDTLEGKVESVTDDLQVAKSQLAKFLDVTTDEIELDEGVA